MADKVRRYTSDDIDVDYSLKRCIHAAECVNRLRAVFNTEQKPWIQPQNASADEIADVIHACPSGALHYERKDGGAAEPTPDKNEVTIESDGPLYIRGDIELTLPDGETMTETRIALCRCGYSDNKPFCDNSHKQANFKASGTTEHVQVGEIEGGGKLNLSPSKNGPVGVKGDMEILDAEGQVVYRGSEAWLCRCGASSNKPFCDGTHSKIDFQAE